MLELELELKENYTFLKVINFFTQLPDSISSYAKALFVHEDGTFLREDLQKSADAGFNPALFDMGLYYFSISDMNYYAEYMKKAADQGYIPAQNHLFQNASQTN